MNLENNHSHENSNTQGSLVEITVDSKKITIHRGHHSIAEIKQISSVPLAFDIEEVINGKLQPLADDGSLTIKGNEVFISHPKDSSSSWRREIYEFSSRAN